MIATFNQKHHPDLFAKVKAAGAEVGKMVAERGWVFADQTISRGATSFIDHLPLNNISLEVELRSAYIAAAIQAAESTNPAN